MSAAVLRFPGGAPQRQIKALRAVRSAAGPGALGDDAALIRAQVLQFAGNPLGARKGPQYSEARALLILGNLRQLKPALAVQVAASLGLNLDQARGAAQPAADPGSMSDEPARLRAQVLQFADNINSARKWAQHSEAQALAHLQELRKVAPGMAAQLAQSLQLEVPHDH
jgi:hypothetical protein